MKMKPKFLSFVLILATFSTLGLADDKGGEGSDEKAHALESAGHVLSAGTQIIPQIPVQGVGAGAPGSGGGGPFFSLLGGMYAMCGVAGIAKTLRGKPGDCVAGNRNFDPNGPPQIIGPGGAPYDPKNPPNLGGPPRSGPPLHPVPGSRENPLHPPQPPQTPPPPTPGGGAGNPGGGK